MNIFLIIAIIITNIVAVAIVYQILKKQSKKEILIFMAAGVTILYLIVSLVYWLSGFGINEQVHESSKNFVIYLFVPINVILFMPYCAIQYKKIRQNKKIEKYDLEKLSTKVTVVIMILIAVSIGEFFYFKNIQKNIKVISEENQKKAQNTVQNTVENTVQNTTMQQTMNVDNNSISNTTTNTVDNNSVNSTTNSINGNEVTYEKSNQVAN